MTPSQLTEPKRPASTAVAGIELASLDDGVLVERGRLLERLDSSRAPVILLRAPAGYGKSVLLAQWAARDRRPFASVSLGPQHNDPAVFLEAVIAALAAIEPVSPGLRSALRVPEPNLDLIVGRLEREIEAREVAMVLVLDEVEQIWSEQVHEVLGALTATFGRGSQLALATRAGSLPQAARMRANRRLDELGQKDLAMTSGECQGLVAGIGVDLASDQLAALIARTEGWPAAIYLSGIALRGETDVAGAIADLAGDERTLVDYMRDEFLARAPASTVEFLTRVSILDRLTGELCDAVLEAVGGAEELRRLSKQNILLIPLDRRDEWFRLHSLFSDMLGAELARTRAAEIPVLHGRASRWWEARGDTGRAIEHAVAAGEFERSGELLWAAVPEYMAQGRYATVRRWLERIELDQILASPHLCLTIAQGALSLGHGDQAEHWARIARELIADRPGSAPDQSLVGGVAMVDGVLARGGSEDLLAQARIGTASFPAGSPWQSLCRMLEGVGRAVRGETERARAALGDAAQRAAVREVTIIQVNSLAQLALLDAAAGDWQRAMILASQARAQVDRSGIAEYPTMVGVFAVSAYVKAHEGLAEEAAADLRSALPLLARLESYGSWYEIQTRVAMAEAAVALNDLRAARRLLDEAAALGPERLGMPALAAWLGQLEEGLQRAEDSRVGGLTPAELRLLRLLPTHLSFARIAAELHVSPNTVKTQAQSVYRKLGASSRPEAVEQALQSGLLDRDA